MSKRLIGALSIAAMGVIAVALGLVLPSATAPARQEPTDDHALWAVATTPRDLVAESSLIFIGTFIESLPTRIIVSAKEPGVTDIAEMSRYEDTGRVFRVNKVIRGDATLIGTSVAAHRQARVWLPKSVTGSTDPVTTYRDDISLTPGRSYVVFLTEFRLSEEGRTYSGYGSPNIAELVNDRLTFLVPTGYRDLLSRIHLPRTLPTAFEGVTLASLQTLVEQDDLERAAAPRNPGSEVQRSDFELGLEQFLAELPLLATARDVESEAARLGLSGRAPTGAAPGLCLKLESFVLSTRGFVVGLCGDGP